MSRTLKLEFADLQAPGRGVLLLFCEEGLKFGPSTRDALKPSGDLIRRVAAAEGFKGKSGSALDIVAPQRLPASRVVVLGVGKSGHQSGNNKAGNLNLQDFVKLGGSAMGRIPALAGAATLMAELPSTAVTSERAAAIAMGVKLRAYAFDRYKTKRADDEQEAGELKLTIAVDDVAGAKKAFALCNGVVEGVLLARDLVNEPANVLTPEEFARRAGGLKKLGVSVETLDPTQMKKLGMHALLGVGQGSQHASRTVIMRWNRGKRGVPPSRSSAKACASIRGVFPSSRPPAWRT